MNALFSPIDFSFDFYHLSESQSLGPVFDELLLKERLKEREKGTSISLDLRTVLRVKQGRTTLLAILPRDS